MSRSNKLQVKSKEIKQRLALQEDFKKEMQNAIIMMTPTMGQARVFRVDYPAFDCSLTAYANDLFKTITADWTMITAILSEDIVNNKFELNVHQETIEATTYNDVSEYSYLSTIGELDSMNPRRRKNVAFFFYMGDIELDLDFIDKLLANDEEFFNSEGLVTGKDQHRQLKEQIRLLGRVA